MSIQRKSKFRDRRRSLRVRKKFKESFLPRVSVFRSSKHIYAQIIDDNQKITLSSCSSLELKDLKGDKKVIANSVGKELAKKALEKGISAVVFDRGKFLYHGRVKALADGMRESGLKV